VEPSARPAAVEAGGHFRGTARFRVTRQLGAGGMGVVYEAVDSEHGDRKVAVKVLRTRDAESLMRLKREFRALTDVRHPNLVAIYELFADGEVWFFTLELVEGVDFLAWLRPHDDVSGEAQTTKVPLPISPSPRTRGEGQGGGLAGQGTTATASPVPALDLPRLRAAFRQLAQGVAFLHSQGRIHRDLKPSNVLVTAEGRVVILDFGLVAELEGEGSLGEGQGQAIVGTAIYMSPEQATSGPVTGASDWYAVGVMLFQALTGRVPFDGPPVQVMLEKQRRPAPAPRDLVPGVPAELDALCVALLRQSPAERPGVSEILSALGVDAPPPPRRVETDFIGREAELETLRQSLALSRGGEPRVVRVFGASGIGKSALLRRFLLEAEAGGAVGLSGRCYERESVPFKALDSVVDALARYLAGLPAERVDALLPRDAQVLARMFPVLGRVPTIRNAPAREVREPMEQRRRAVQALRELVARLADRRPVVVVVDDAQWGDADSAAVLEELLRPPNAPWVLLIVASRGEVTPLDLSRDEGASPGPARTGNGAAQPERSRGPTAQLFPGVATLDLRLEGLPRADCEQLARRVVADETRVGAAVAEAQGNPFLLQQLLELRGEQVRLEDVVGARVASLPAPARVLLEVVAVSGSPVAEKAAVRAAGLEESDLDSLALLKASRLVRGSGEGERLEAWHDRIRETVTAMLDPQRVRELHARLADALQQQPEPDLDSVAWHLGAAGLSDRAAEATLVAARRAAAQLAFERGAVLFRRALELLSTEDLRRRELCVALGDCLADAGRGKAAAEAYRQAEQEKGAEPLTEGDVLELDRRAAEQLLRSGHVDEGLAAIDRVLRKVHMTLAPTPWRALGALAFRRAHVTLRGLHFDERPAGAVDAALLRRIDVCWSVSIGLSMVDTIKGASYQTRQLLLALDAGEPMRVARALAAEAAFVATAGKRSERRAAQLIASSRELAQRVGDGRLLGLVDFCDCLTRFLSGRWREAKELSAQAEHQFRDVGSAVSWEAATARLFSVWSLFYLGEIAELSRGIPALVREAQSRGDRYALTSLRSGLANVSLLAADDPAGARQAVREVMARWSSKSFHFQHYWALLSEGMIDLYQGTPEEGWRRTKGSWKALERSMLLRIQNVRVEATYLRARLALATGRLDEVLDAASDLDWERVGWARGFALALRGLAAGQDGAPQLREAIDVFAAEDMNLFAAATRLRLGEVQGGDVGKANVRAATAWMQAQGIKAPDRMAQMLAPALPLPATPGRGSG